jgi:hypothetical protein
MDNPFLSLLTGYDKNSLSLVDSPPDDANDMAKLIDKFLDVSQFQYSDEDTSIGLEGSRLLAQLPWLTPWTDLFKPIEPVKVC